MTDDRLTLIARINALIAVRDRLVTALLRTGADPEWVARRACTDTWAGTEMHRLGGHDSGLACTTTTPHTPPGGCVYVGTEPNDRHDETRQVQG